MTRQLLYETGTPFGQWLRVQKDLDSKIDGAALSIQNLDYIIHQYADNKVMLIEEKRFNGEVPFAQQDTHKVLHFMLRYANGKPVPTKRGYRPVEYYGYHILTFSHTTPDDSEWMKWDGHPISVDDLKRMLRFEIDPNERSLVTIGAAQENRRS